MLNSLIATLGVTCVLAGVIVVLGRAVRCLELTGARSMGRQARQPAAHRRGATHLSMEQVR